MRYWQVNKHVLRVLRVVVRIALGLFLCLYVLPLLLFRIPAVQRSVASRVSKELTKLFDAPVSLARVDLLRWTDLELHQVLVRDSLNRPMLTASRLVGGISLLDLITDQEVRITSARLFSAHLALVRDPRTGRLNIQHVIDHLARPKKDSSSIPVDINSIIIRDMRLTLEEKGRQRLRLDRISTRIRRLRFAPQYVGGALDELSFASSLGLEVTDLTGQVELRQQQLTLLNLQLALPKSQVSIPLLQLDLTKRGLPILQALRLGRSSLSLTDLAFLAPVWRGRSEALQLSASYQQEPHERGVGQLSAELAGQLALEQSFQLSWDAAARLQQLTLKTPTLQLRSSLLALIRPLLGQQALPEELITRLGNLRYQGELSYLPAQALKGTGQLASDQGRLEYELAAVLRGQQAERVTGFVRTEQFDLGALLGPKTGLGALAGQVTLDAKHEGQGLEGWSLNALATLRDLDFRGYRYQGLQLSLQPQQGQRHLVDLKLDDPNADLHLEGSARLSTEGLRDLEARLDLQHVRADQLHLLPNLHEDLSLQASLSLDRIDLDRMQGHIALEGLQLQGSSGLKQLDELRLRLHGSPERGRLLRLTSPYLSVELTGNYTLASLIPDAQQTLSHHLPSLFPPNPLWARRAAQASYELRLELKQIPEVWAEYLRLPLGLDQGAHLWATLEGDARRIQCHASFPQLRLGANQLRSAKLDFDGETLELSSDLRLAKGALLKGLLLRSQLSQDSVYTQLNLGEDDKGVPNGTLGLAARFLRTPERHLGIQLGLDSSRLRIHSEAWRIAPATLRWQPGLLSVDGLDLSSADRRVSVSGRLSEHAGDRLSVALQRINLLYILESIGVGFNMLDADLTGTGTASLRAGVVSASADVSSSSFHVKGVDVGALRAALHFNSSEGLIHLDGEVQQPEGGHSAVAGYIRPVGGAGIDLRFDAERLRTDFIAKFMDTLFDEVRGRATGKMRLFGRFEEGVTVEGLADVTEGSIGVRLLGTRYLFEGPLRFTPESILFDKIPVRDDEGHTGRLDGSIRHRFFDHFDLDLRADGLDRMKVLQTQSKQSLPFFGTAYGSGRATLRGKLPRLQLGVEMTAQQGTDVTLDFNQTDVRKEDRLFTFKPLRPRSERDSLLYLPLPPPEEAQGTELNMQMSLRVTPAAQLTLRLGSGEIPNEVKARCEGALTIDVPHIGSPKTYGSLRLVEGSYVFNFEQLTRRRFTLREGGSLDFRGDPMAAEIDLKASYSLTASISDLDATLAAEARRNTVPVNCILQLGGVITQPSINLGLELPGAEPEIERRLQSLINTRDERNRQVLYLMTLGKFYTPETRQTTTTSVSDGWASLASSTISEQLTNLLGNLSKDIQFGTNIRTSNTAFEDTDVELQFSGSWFNNRLSINGNVGYHNNPFLQGKYIGEFDLEYKLNPEGTLRLKGYNHYNNMYQYLRQSLTTQGIGVMFQRRFDSFSELLSRKQAKKRTFVPKQQPSH